MLSRPTVPPHRMGSIHTRVSESKHSPQHLSKAVSKTSHKAQTNTYLFTCIHIYLNPIISLTFSLFLTFKFVSHCFSLLSNSVSLHPSVPSETQCLSALFSRKILQLCNSPFPACSSVSHRLMGSMNSESNTETVFQNICT